MKKFLPSRAQLGWFLLAITLILGFEYQQNSVYLLLNGTSVSTTNPLPTTVSQGNTWSEDVSYAGSSPVNAHVSKASAATLGGFIVGNYSSSIVYFQLFNSTSTPVNTNIPIRQWPIGIGVSTSPTIFALGAGYYGPGGLTGTFTSGLSWAISTTSGALTLASASSCDVEVDYQ